MKMHNVLSYDVIEQDRVIRQALKESTKNIFLEAGAGAGKSTLMVERIIHQVCTGAQKIDQIVAITFTEKAATELQEKISKRLDEILADLALQEDKKELCKEIESKRHLLFIGTIHSFCQKLIQERPIESGVPVRFTMVEEDVEKNKRQQFFYNQIAVAENDLLELFSLLEEFDLSIYDLVDLFLNKVTNLSLGINEEATPLTLNLKILHEDIATKKILLEEKLSWELKPIKLVDVVKSGYKTKTKELHNYNLLQALAKGESFISSTSVYPFYKEQIDNVISEISKYELANTYNSLTHLLTEKFECEGKEISLSEIFTSMTRKDKLGNPKLNNPFEILERFHNGIEVNDGLKFATGYKSVLYKGKQITNLALLHQIEKVTSIASVQPIFKYFDTIFEGTYDEKIIKILKLSDQEKVERNNVYQIQSMLSKQSEEIIAKKYLQIAKDEAFFEQQILNWCEKYSTTEAAEIINEILQNLLNDWAQQYLLKNSINGELTFDDLLYKAYVVLQDEDARQLFHDKYRHLYVDEVQDTDLLQMKILFLLTANAHPENWSTAETSSNSLFLVGDPKQSIYRFRNADLRIYDQIKRIATDSDNWLVEQLTINFRSTGYLTEWFNEKFEPKFGLQTDSAIQPIYKSMEAATTKEVLATLSEEIETGVKFYCVKISEKEQHASESDKQKAVLYEAQEIAKWIHANKGKLQIATKDEKTESLTSQDMKFSDVLIILPKTKNMDVYIRALHEAGIPTSFSGRIEISGYKEIQKLIALTHFVAKPYLDTLLAAVAVCEDMTLSEIFELQKGKTYEQLVQDEQLQHYARLIDIARLMTPLSFLEYVIYQEPQLILGEASTKLQYKTSMSLLTTFLEKVRPQQFVSLKQMSNEFRAMIESRYSLEYEMSVEQGEDAVRVMNLHKSKGLEAAVVFLAADADSQEDKLSSYIERNDEDAKAIYSLYKKSYFNTSIVYTPENLKQYEQELKDHEDAEAIRKLYVAATRAKQLLFVGLFEEAAKKASNNKNYYSLYESTADSSFEWEDLNLEEIQNDAVPYIIKDLLEKYEQVCVMDKSKSYDEVSPSKLENNNSTIEANDETAIAVQQKEIERTQQFKGRLWGSIVHKTFEMYIKDLMRYTADERVAMFHNNFIPSYAHDEEFVTIAITRGLLQYDLTTKDLADFDMTEDLGQNRNARLKQIIDNEAIRTELKQTLQTFINNDRLNSMLYDCDRDLYPEIPFKVKYDQMDKTNDEQELANIFTEYMSGVIDLVIVEEDGITIIDYKTNAIRPDETGADFKKRLRNEYNEQMQAYKKYAAQIFDREVVAVYLYATGIDGLVEC